MKVVENTSKVAGTSKVQKLNKRKSASNTGDAKIFADGVSFYKLFWIFVIISVLGSFYEQILHFVATWFSTGGLSFELRQGVIYGPFNTIYGTGAVVLTLLFAKKDYPKWKTFLIGAASMGVVEVICSLGFEYVLGGKSWNYSDHPLNVDGRTSVPVMMVWGAMAVLFAYYVYPFLSKWIEKIPYKQGIAFTKILVIFMALNITISWTALIRQNLRHHDVNPITPIGEFYDDYYSDEFLIQYYPNINRGRV